MSAPLPEPSLLDSAWTHYVGGRDMPQAEASEVWRLFNALGDNDERVYKIVTLGRWIDHEAARGKRCAVCAGIDGSHDDC